MSTYDASVERAETALNAVPEYARVPGDEAIDAALKDLRHLAEIRRPEAGAMSTSDGMGGEASPGKVTAAEMAEEYNAAEYPGNDWSDAVEARMVEAIDELQRVRAALRDVRGAVPSIAAVAMKDHGVEEF